MIVQKAHLGSFAAGMGFFYEKTLTVLICGLLSEYEALIFMGISLKIEMVERQNSGIIWKGEKKFNEN